MRPALADRIYRERSILERFHGTDKRIICPRESLLARLSIAKGLQLFYEGGGGAEEVFAMVCTDILSPSVVFVVPPLGKGSIIESPNSGWHFTHPIPFLLWLGGPLSRRIFKFSLELSKPYGPPSKAVSGEYIEFFPATRCSAHPDLMVRNANFPIVVSRLVPNVDIV
jgi:hypothetical protein